MDYRIEIRTLAAREIIAAYDWYEAQREGLGAEFLQELDHFYNSLVQNPFTHSFYSEPIRQGKIRRFPYVVVYDVFDNKIVIFSVFMTRQSPENKRTG
jgi:plasmid stabilization system protein ParE